MLEHKHVCFESGFGCDKDKEIGLPAVERRWTEEEETYPGSLEQLGGKERDQSAEMEVPDEEEQSRNMRHDLPEGKLFMSVICIRGALASWCSQQCGNSQTK